MYERNDKNKLVKVKPESNICRYDEGSKHENCKHQHYCIFNPKRIELEEQITGLTNELESLKNYDNNLLNGDIVYHDSFKEFIEAGDFVGLRRKVKDCINVKVMELNELVRFRNRVLDGMIGGYGYD